MRRFACRNFQSEMFYCNGYYFNKMNGQGSVVQIIKEKN